MLAVKILVEEVTPTAEAVGLTIAADTVAAVHQILGPNRVSEPQTTATL